MSRPAAEVSEPDWERFGLHSQQPTISESHNDYSDVQDTDSEENELFKEQQVREVLSSGI